MKLAEENGYTFVHPFDDLDVATGQGSIAMEIFDELPDVDYILAPIGGGGLITGVSTLTYSTNTFTAVSTLAGASAFLAEGTLFEGVFSVIFFVGVLVVVFLVAVFFVVVFLAVVFFAGAFSATFSSFFSSTFSCKNGIQTPASGCWGS